MFETTVGKFSPQVGGTFTVADKIKFQLFDTLAGNDRDLSVAHTLDTPDWVAVPLLSAESIDWLLASKA